MTPARRSSRLLLVLVVLLAGVAPLAHADAGTEDTRLYVGHAARLTARMPADWTFDAAGPWDYRGPDGFVATLPLGGETLGDACASLPDQYGFQDRPGTPAAAPVIAMTEWNGGPACRFDGLMSGTATALVVPHPAPFDLWEEQIGYAALVADSDHIDELTATLSFDPALVTPAEYMRSFIDLVEARAYWSDGVDWDGVRQRAALAVGGIQDTGPISGVRAEVMQALYRAGDNHSIFLESDWYETADDAVGFGFAVAGPAIVQVATDGPADRAGLRVGDRIIGVDGRRYFPTIGLSDPSTFLPPRTVFEVERDGTVGPLRITVEQGPYEAYYEPIGRRMNDRIGYLAINGFISGGREEDYVRAGNAAIATADGPPACGWVLDLRLNSGGLYVPMIGAVGPLVPDGAFLGFRTSGGHQTWVTWDGATVTNDGWPVADFSVQSPHDLPAEHLPVAVLTGPYTASAGEAVTLAFAGRPDRRSFGEVTAGLTTANSAISLFDGALVNLATAAMTDRDGRTYMDGIPPDEPVTIAGGRSGRPTIRSSQRRQTG